MRIKTIKNHKTRLIYIQFYNWYLEHKDQLNVNLELIKKEDYRFILRIVEFPEVKITVSHNVIDIEAYFSIGKKNYYDWLGHIHTEFEEKEGKYTCSECGATYSNIKEFCYIHTFAPFVEFINSKFNKDTYLLVRIDKNNHKLNEIKIRQKQVKHKESDLPILCILPRNR